MSIDTVRIKPSTEVSSDVGRTAEDFTSGDNQLKLSPSYIPEYCNGTINVHKTDKLLYICSEYKCLIREIHDVDQIQPYQNNSMVCKCRAGARVVGVCSHISAIIVYLSNERHEIFSKSFGVSTCTWRIKTTCQRQ